MSTVPGQAIFRDVPEPRRVSLRQKVWNSRFDYLYVAPAILVTGLLFGASHYTHPEVGLALLPYYVAVSAVYGLLASATNSTYPSMVLHAGGNLFSAFGLFVQGRSEWAPAAVPAPTIWETGPDAPFLTSVGACIIVGAVTGWAFRALFRAARAATPITA